VTFSSLDSSLVIKDLVSAIQKKIGNIHNWISWTTTLERELTALTMHLLKRTSAGDVSSQSDNMIGQSKLSASGSVLIHVNYEELTEPQLSE
jgi:hypothetical protein